MLLQFIKNVVTKELFERKIFEKIEKRKQQRKVSSYYIWFTKSAKKETKLEKPFGLSIFTLNFLNT